jgi:hypothetical protein
MIALHEDMAREQADINVYDSGAANEPAVLAELPRLILPPSIRRSAA